MAEDTQRSETETSQRKRKAGAKVFGWTLIVLIVLIVAYVVAHVVTFRAYGHTHYEAADVTVPNRIYWSQSRCWSTS